MENTPHNKDEFNSTGLVVFLYRWRKTLLVILSISLVASVIFSSSWFITPKYKSTVILFPVSTSSVSKALMSENSGPTQDITQLGEDEEAEQMLQILNSNKIRDRIIRKYHLMKHYGIDSTSPYKNSQMFRRFEKNISFMRTEYMAVKISVFDEDAKMAAAIANNIADLVDSVKNDMQKQRAIQGYKIVQQEYDQLQAEVNTIVDSLIVIGKLGVNDYETQAEMLNEQLAIAVANNNKTGTAALEKRMQVLSQYGGIFLALKNALEFKTEQLTLLKSKLKEAKVDAEQDIPQKFVVNSAFVAERTSYPVRWLIVVLTVFSTFFMSIVILIIMENLREIKEKTKAQKIL